MKKLEINDLGKFKLVHNLDVYKNKAIFVVTGMDLEKDDYLSRLYLYDGRRVFQFTSGSKDNNPKFSPNGKLIAFTSKRNKESKESELYVISTGGGEARLLTRFKYGINFFDFSPDSEKLLVLSPADIKRRRKKEKSDVHVIKEIPFWFNGTGWIYGKRSQIFLVDVESGKKRKVTRGTLNITFAKFNSRGDKIFFIAQEDRERRPLVSDLFVMDLKSKRIEKLTDSTMSINAFEFVNRERLILRAKGLERGFSTNTHIYLFNIETKEMKKLTAKLDRSAYNSLNSDVRGVSRNPLIYRDGWVYYIATDGPRANLFRVNLKGDIEKVIGGDRSVETFGIGRGIFFIAQNPTAPTELYLLRDGKEKKLTNFNGWIREYKISEPEHFRVKASDGVEIDAWIMRPVDFKGREKYPAVVEIHGGPKTAYGYAFMHEFQILAARGFVVIFSNPRGSDGYGTEFADIRGHYGERDYQDIMETVDEAIKRFGFIDGERVGVTGGSYGGFMTNWIVTHTNRFRAAVTQRSITNWISFFGTTDIGYYFAPDQIGKDPWDNLEGYWEKSPLKHAKNVETPLLIIHSTEDYRCWLTEALQFFTALKYLGKTVELALFQGENHDLSRKGKPKHRIERLKLIVGWFEKHLD